jgi:multicomponent Na+:H+ antiporter subunit A
MTFAILSGFAIAFFLIFLPNYFTGKRALLLSLLPISLFFYFLNLALTPVSVYTSSMEWIPSLGINLDLSLDGLSMVFCLLITGIGSLVFIYSSAYIHKDESRFYGFLSLFMASMLGMVLSDNMLVFFIFWELTSISSFFLIGFDRENSESRRSAIISLSVTGGGGLFLLLGVLFLYTITGSFSFHNLPNYYQEIHSHPYYLLILGFILTGAFTKSAQFPFQFWLPAAMKAPTPVSTYLHSATMVKAGIYLIARLTPSFGGDFYWNNTLLVFGGITMLVGAIRSIFHTDLKSILAYTTISALGILVFLLGLGTKLSYTAAIVFIMVHGIYKAGFFLITGILDHKTGTRDITKLRGLKTVLLPTAIAAVLLSLSNAGFPTLFGFIGKDLIYESALVKGNSAYLILIPFITNVFLIIAGFLVGVRPFFGKPILDISKIKKPSPFLWVPPIILALLGVLLGVLPDSLSSSIVQPALGSFGFRDSIVHLAIWHGINPVLFWSLTTLSIGTFVYAIWKPSKSISDSAISWDQFSPSRLLFILTHWHHKGSFAYKRFWMNDHLRYYVITILVFLTSLLVFFEFYIGNGFRNIPINYASLSEVTYYEVGIISLLMVAIWITISTRSRLNAVAALGVSGFTICLLFVFYSAPDLAMTQFSIDTLTVILFVLILYKLPPFRIYSNLRTRIRDGVLSLAVGSLITIIILQVLQVDVDKSITRYYLENAYILAKGKNVVNVILVDFRGMDTMIEIIVLAMSAIGVYALLKFKLNDSEESI